MAKKREPEKRGRPRIHTEWTPELLQERAQEYFKQCDDRRKQVATMAGIVSVANPRPYTVEGLCCYLKISVVTFRAWRKNEDSLGEKAAMLHQLITANRVEGALEGTQNASFARFMLTNNAPEDYKEKVEVENTVSEEVKGILEMATGSWLEKLNN